MTGPVEHDTTCPWCGRRNPLHQGLEGTTPKPGDIGLCWRCGGPGVFTDDLGLREPTKEEFEAMKKDAKVIAALKAMVEARTPSDAIRRWTANFQ
jgi:hypothetical protein